MPAFTRVLRGRRRGLERAARRRRGTGHQAHRGDRRARAAPAHRRDGARPRRSSRRRGATSRAQFDPRVGRLRPGAEVPAGDDDRLPVPGARAHRRARGPRDDHHHARRDGRGRHPRPARRRLRALLHRRDVAGPPLREDALRQRAPHRARTCTAILATGEPRYRAVVEDIVGYVLRDLADPAGGFYSAEDADSEGVEGKFYLWSPAEIRDVCGDDADEVIRYYGVTEAGNFVDPHTNFRGSILHVATRNEPEPEPCSRAQRSAACSHAATRESGPASTTRCCSDGTRCSSRRSPRPPPRSTATTGWTRRATQRRGSCCASSATTRRPLPRSWRAPYLAYAEDYAALLEALLTLAELDDLAWLAEARARRRRAARACSSTPTAAASSRPVTTPSRSSCARRTSSTTRPRPRTRSRPTACCGSRTLTGDDRYARARRRDPRDARRADARHTPPASRTCSARSSVTCARRSRS